MAKKRIIDMVCEVSLAINNSIIHSGEGREFYDHKVYIFDHTFKTIGTKRQQLKILKKAKIKIEEREAMRVKKIAQKTAKIVIKEQIKITKKGKRVKINYINLFDTDAEISNTILCDISKYHEHYLKDKEVLWTWKDKNGGRWNLVLFAREK